MIAIPGGRPRTCVPSCAQGLPAREALPTPGVSREEWHTVRQSGVDRPVKATSITGRHHNRGPLHSWVVPVCGRGIGSGHGMSRVTSCQPHCLGGLQPGRRLGSWRPGGVAPSPLLAYDTFYRWTGVVVKWADGCHCEKL